MLEQADATSWMGMYCLNMLDIALELARENPSYQDVANKFFEHFLLIAHAMNHIAGEGPRLWDEEDGFYYDVLRLPDGRERPAARALDGRAHPALRGRRRSSPTRVERFPAFGKRARWFLAEPARARGALPARWTCRARRERRLLALLEPRQARARARAHARRGRVPLAVRRPRRSRACTRRSPTSCRSTATATASTTSRARVATGLFGGNSNWRGPVWFPVNYLLIESLQRYTTTTATSLKVECPTGSGQMMTLWEVAARAVAPAHRALHRAAPTGGARRTAPSDRVQHDPHFRDLVTFYEYFHGDTGEGLGARTRPGGPRSSRSCSSSRGSGGAEQGSYFLLSTSLAAEATDESLSCRKRAAKALPLA